MEIHFYGANCVRLVDKKISMVIDDNLDSLGLKPATKADDVSLFTLDKEPKNIGRFLIDGPGEYEISEVSVKGVPAKAHIDAEGLRSTMYNIEFQGFSVGIIGHVHPDLSDDQLENLGLIDILIILFGWVPYIKFHFSSWIIILTHTIPLYAKRD